MTLWATIGRQLAHPTGLTGRLAGHAMRILNARPNALAVAALDLHPADAVLELGCGPGHGVRLLADRVPDGVVHAVDRSAVMLAQARARNRAAVAAGRVRFYRGPFESLPFPGASMDKVLAVNVAYFWRDADAVLGEVRRVLRPGGLLSVYVTDAAVMGRWKFADPETHRLFDRDGLAAVLRAGGFRADRIAVAPVAVLPGVPGLVATASLPGP